MIYDGIPTDQVETYLHDRAWLVDAARLLDVPVQTLVEDLIATMTRGRAVITRDGRLHAAAPHTAVVEQAIAVPFPRDGPAVDTTAGAAER